MTRVVAFLGKPIHRWGNTTGTIIKPGPICDSGQNQAIYKRAYLSRRKIAGLNKIIYIKH